MDWNKLKAEYIAGGISYRKLAQKHGVSFNTLKDIAVGEKWTELRQQAHNDATTKIIETVVEENTNYTASIYDVADKLLEKIYGMVSCERLTAQNIKNLSSAIKDIKDIKGVKSDLDIQEQNARIDKLRKEIDGEQKDTNINITFGDEVKKYGV